jgi:acetylornithine deacetylase/succinyl-diaminopimelate desuccinylase-like protein
MSQRQQRLHLLDRYIRIPTVSREVTAARVEDVRTFWREQGIDLDALYPESEAGTPVLYAELPGPPGAPSILLYGHYDVQPTGDPDLWVWEGVACSPFEPAYFLDTKQVDPRSLPDDALDRVQVVARGSCDNKGQHLANILGALDAARAGTQRWTVKILLDGEEEHGSPNLRAVCERYRDRLTTDILVGSDGPKPRNQPALLMGVRGLLTVNVIAENGQRASVHSGNYGNIVPNPVLPLARVIAEIEERVRDYAAEHDTFRKEAAGIFAEWADRATWQPFLWPTVNTNHLMTDGASPKLTRTIIPRSIHARLDIRLTPDTPPDAVIGIVERVVERHQGLTEGISVTVRCDGMPASYTSPKHPAFDWLLGLLAEQGDGEPVALPILGGTLPNYVFTDVLGIPSFWLPAANADNQQHDINEHYVLKHFFQQTRLYERVVSTLPAGTFRDGETPEERRQQ